MGVVTMRKYILFAVATLAWWLFAAAILWVGFYYIWGTPARLLGLTPTFNELFFVVAIVNICTSSFNIDDFKKKKDDLE